jgi:hypothetical protein
MSFIVELGVAVVKYGPTVTSSKSSDLLLQSCFITSVFTEEGVALRGEDNHVIVLMGRTSRAVKEQRVWLSTKYTSV